MSRPPPALSFLENPSNVTSSLGKTVRLRCRVRGAGEPPEMGWQRDGHPLELADSDQAQVPLSEDVWLATSQLRWATPRRRHSRHRNSPYRVAPCRVAPRRAALRRVVLRSRHAAVLPCAALPGAAPCCVVTHRVVP